MIPSSSPPELVLLARSILTPHGVTDGAVVIAEGRVLDVVRKTDIPTGCPVEDFGNLFISPGAVDSHVHINEPGRTEWEGFESATRAAAAGGITTLVDMPLNSTPVTTTRRALLAKTEAADGRCMVDCGFYGGVVPENAKVLEPLIESGVLGIKAFLVHSGIDDFPNVTEAHLRDAMPAIAAGGVPLLVHAELASDVVQNGQHSPHSYRRYLDSRPRKWENDAIELMIRLCREFACRVHIVHLSSSDAIPALTRARESGLPITVETCPHYLLFSSEEIPDGDTRFKCAPPIRENENREMLWEALDKGVIDFIVSDHSPCPPAMKQLESGDFQKAWGGISSLQFGLSAVWTEARKRGYSPERLSKWMSSGPSASLGLTGKKGAIQSGYDADLVVWNPDEEFEVTSEIIHHRHALTPYEGRTLLGKVKATYLRGQKVFEDGRFGEPSGEILMRSRLPEQA